MRNRTVCFTGHRRIPLLQRHRIAAQLDKTVESLIGEGYLYFGAGGALGFDTMAAETVLRMREKYPDVRLILVLPCRDQSRRWSKKDIRIYEDIKSRADKVVYIADTYYTGCMQVRNRHLVDSSAVCVCYLTESGGGTAYTVRYAEKEKLRIINIA